MDLQTFVRVLRKRWRTIVTTLLLTLAAVALLTMLAPRKYESTVQFFVSTADSSSNAQLAQGGTFTQQRVKSYTELIATPKVLGPVAQELGVDDVSSLAIQVTATAPPDTVLIDASVTDTSPQRAYDIAKALGAQFPKTISEIERVSADRPSPIKVTTVREPVVETTPVSPRPARNLALGLVLGALLGLGLALLRDRLDNRVRTKEDLEGLTDVPVHLALEPHAEQHAPHSPLSDAAPHLIHVPSYARDAGTVCAGMQPVRLLGQVPVHGATASV